MTFVAISVSLAVADVPDIASSSFLDLASQAPSANVMVFLGRDTKIRVWRVERQQTADRRPQTADPRPQTPDPRPQTPDHRPQTPDRLKFKIKNSKFQTSIKFQFPKLIWNVQKPGTRGKRALSLHERSEFSLTLHERSEFPLSLCAQSAHNSLGEEHPWHESLNLWKPN